MQSTEIIHDVIRDEAIYTPTEVALLVKCSPSYVRRAIQDRNLVAFKFGGRLLRIKGIEAKKWIAKFEDISLGSSEADIARSGMKEVDAADLALASILRPLRPRH